MCSIIKVIFYNLELTKSDFFFMGAKLYNLLPRDIRLSETEADFIRKVKCFNDFRLFIEIYYFYHFIY